MARLYNRETGKKEDVADDLATEGISSGKYGALQGIDVPAIAPDGEVMWVRSDRAETAFRDEGYTYAPPEAFDKQAARAQEANLQKHFGDTSGQALTFTASALDAASLGATTAIAGGLSSDGRAALRAAKEANPGSFTAGQVVGSFTPTGITRGITSLATQAASKIVGAGVKAANVGALTGRAAKAADFLTEATRAGIATGLEGAAFGLGTGVSEAVLGDHESAADVLTTVGSGLFWGAAIGGGIGGTLSLAGSAAKSLWAGLAKKGDTIEGALQDKAKSALIPVLSNKETRALVERGLEPSYVSSRAFKEFGGDLNKAADTVAEELASHEQGIQRGIDEILGAAKEATAEQKSIIAGAVAKSGGGARETMDILNKDASDVMNARKALLKEKYSDTPAMVDKQVLGLTDRLATDLPRNATGRQIRDDMGGIYEEYLRIPNPSVNDEIDMAWSLRRKADEFIDTGSLSSREADLIHAFRSNVDNLALGGNEKFGKAVGHPLMDAREVVRQSDDIYGATKSFSNALLNKAGTATDKAIVARMVHPRYGEYIDAAMAKLGDLSTDIKAWVQAGRDTAAQKAVLDRVSSKLNIHMGQPAHIKRDLDTVRMLMEDISPSSLGKVAELQKRAAQLGSLEGLGTVEKYIKLSEMAGKKVDPIYDAIKRFDADFEKLAQFQKEARRFREGMPPAAPPSLIPSKGVVGSILGGPVGTAIGTGLDVASGIARTRQDPMRAVNTIRQVQGAIRMGNIAIQKAVVGTAKAITSKGIQRVIINQKARPESNKDKRDKYPAVRERLITLKDPTKFEEVMTAQTAGIDGIDNLKTSLMARQYAAVNFLSSKLPDDPQEQYQVFGAGKHELSDSELHKFYRYYDTANDPMKALDKMANGFISVEELETLEALHPDLLSKVRDQVLENLANSKETVPYEKRLVIGQLFGVESDASLKPNFISTIQAQYEEKDKGGRPVGGGGSGGGGGTNSRGRKLDMDVMESTASPTDRLTYS